MTVTPPSRSNPPPPLGVARAYFVGLGMGMMLAAILLFVWRGETAGQAECRVRFEYAEGLVDTIAVLMEYEWCEDEHEWEQVEAGS